MIYLIIWMICGLIGYLIELNKFGFELSDLIILPLALILGPFTILMVKLC